MEKAVVIANPAASQFTGGSHRDVMAILNRAYSAEAIWPGSGQDAGEKAARAVESGASLVVAMGGDGVVHHVAQGLVGTDVPLGVIPVGTTNVVSRLLDLPTSPAKAARVLIDPDPAILAGTVRLELTRGATVTTHHALFACGLGLDADVVVAADKDPHKKYRFGSLHYASTALNVAFRSFPKKRPHVDITADERSTRVSAAVLQFRDLYTYFGRMPLTISQDRPDPITALLLSRLRRRRVPGIAGRILLRRDLSDVPEVEIWESLTEMEAMADPPVAVQADGESLGLAEAVRATWAPESLSLIRGQSSP